MTSLKADDLHLLCLDGASGDITDDLILNSSPSPRLQAVTVAPDGTVYAVAVTKLHRLLPP